MALVILGTVTRPEGSDSYPPAAGTRVAYAYAQPIVDLDAQADRHGWPNLGILGDVAHLKKHGGHTPWRAGSKRGVVWALDRTMPPGFRQWLVAKCKSDYDTTWIRFFNIDGMQFGQDGTYLGTSADHHLHLEVEDGAELKHVTLFDDYAREAGIVALDDSDIKRVWDYKVGSTALGIPPKAASEWLKVIEAAAREAKSAAGGIAKLEAKLDTALGNLTHGLQVLADSVGVLAGKIAALEVEAGASADQVADEIRDRLAE